MYNNNNKNLVKSKVFFTRITDEEIQLYCINYGLKPLHIILLKRLMLFGKKSEVFSVSNAFLQEVLGNVSRSTVYSYLKMLEKLGFIKTFITHQVYHNKVIKHRMLSVNFNLCICSNSTHKKLNKNISISKAESIKTQNQKSVIKDTNPQIEKLTHIFLQKTQEVLKHINPEPFKHKINYEAIKFNTYYQVKGFNQWTLKDGKRLTYRAVEHWILSDKYGLFADLKKENHRMETERIKQKNKKEEEQEFMKIKEIEEFYSALILENYKNKTHKTEEQILNVVIEKFKNQPYLKDFLNQNKIKEVV